MVVAAGCAPNGELEVVVAAGCAPNRELDVVVDVCPPNAELDVVVAAGWAPNRELEAVVVAGFAPNRELDAVVVAICPPNKDLAAVAVEDLNPKAEAELPIVELVADGCDVPEAELAVTVGDCGEGTGLDVGWIFPAELAAEGLNAKRELAFSDICGVRVACDVGCDGFPPNTKKK